MSEPDVLTTVEWYRSAKVRIVPSRDGRDPYNYTLAIETETKGETK